jgi:hypothetical protein
MICCRASRSFWRCVGAANVVLRESAFDGPKGRREQAETSKAAALSPSPSAPHQSRGGNGKRRRFVGKGFSFELRFRQSFGLIFSPHLSRIPPITIFDEFLPLEPYPCKRISSSGKWVFFPSPPRGVF